MGRWAGAEARGCQSLSSLTWGSPPHHSPPSLARLFSFPHPPRLCQLPRGEKSPPKKWETETSWRSKKLKVKKKEEAWKKVVANKKRRGQNIGD